MATATDPTPAPGAADARPPAVELSGITKRFPGVVANHDIDLRVTSGTIHAIVGENGAGKSTLMKILYGMLRPDEGTITVEGRPHTFKSPTDAIKASIGMVHQHFMLADNLTVLENVVLGAEPGFPYLTSVRKARARIDELGEAYGLTVEPEELVEDLGVGDRQRVEILKVLYRGARILILDEPTAVLVPQEVDELFRNLRELKAEGLTVIFISHKLDEVLDIADAITVIRDGTTVTTVDDPSTVTARDLANLMVGHEMPSPEAREATVRDEVELEVRGLTVLGPTGRPAVSDIDLTIHRGEVLGVAGVDGNGQHELVEAILGLVPVAAGEIRFGGEDITAWSTRRRRRAGIAYIPADRQRDGLLLEAPLWENVALGHQTDEPFERRGFIDTEASRKQAEEVIRDYDVMTPGVDVATHALSGGNQQKLIMGRELSADPKVLVASHPTRGVDVGAQAELWDELRRCRREGLATLLVSADLDELIGLSDQLVVLYRGRIVARLDPATVTLAQLGAHMTGAAEPDEPDASSEPAGPNEPGPGAGEADTEVPR